ncbi:hypothetical protein [Halobacillus salinus]|nr:hypothetical protein [Halobacillus salinus]
MMIPIMAIILLAGCLPQSNSVEVLSAAESDYELFLYTKSSEKEHADDYLNALLDWKTSRNNVENIQFTQSTTKSDEIGVSEDLLPTLVIKREGRVVESISGKNSSDKILTQLENTLSF